FLSTLLCSLSLYVPLPHLHSFPTRRSSDLPVPPHNELNKELGKLFFTVMPVIFREEKIVFPVALQAIPQVGWDDMLQQGSGLGRSEEHTSELQSRENLVCRLLLEKKKISHLVLLASVECRGINPSLVIMIPLKVVVVYILVVCVIGLVLIVGGTHCVASGLVDNGG